MKHFFLFFLLSISFSTLIFAQDTDPILPTQAEAIRSLAQAQGFSPSQLDDYLIQKYAKSLNGLSRSTAAEVIRLFQSQNPPVPGSVQSGNLLMPTRSQSGTITKPAERALSNDSSTVKMENEQRIILAQFLEPGMSKKFHLINGNIIQGTITKIEQNICHLETVDGLLKIPTSDILEETADISKRDDSRYIGPVIGETTEDISIRSKYGDVTINKKDIRDMNRYHGGKLVPWAEEKKRFYRSQVSLIDIFFDPTAFPLEPNALYISGLSIGYGFTEHFMVNTSFGNNFNGDLNIKPLWQFYSDHSANHRSAFAVGANLYSRHDMSTVISSYARFIRRKSDGLLLSDPRVVTSVEAVMKPDYRTSFHGAFYLVYSKLWALESGRGEMGYHIGIKTSTLPFIKNNMLNDQYQWTNDALNTIPFRFWMAFEYDLTKSLKFAALGWADNGYRYRTLNEVRKDYFEETPLILDAKGGEYRTIDFDFGFLYAANESFRIGIHFKEAYIVFFWRIVEL